MSETVYQAGDLGLFPGGDTSAAIDWTTPSEGIFLTIEAPYLRRLASQDASLAPVALQERLQFDDPLLAPA